MRKTKLKISIRKKSKAASYKTKDTFVSTRAKWKSEEASI